MTDEELFLAFAKQTGKMPEQSEPWVVPWANPNNTSGTPFGNCYAIEVTTSSLRYAYCWFYFNANGKLTKMTVE